ncbi:lysophospholipid acyltransferase family protein [Chloroflexota bacterium]
MQATQAVQAESETYSFEARGWYRVARGIANLLAHLLCRFEVVGLEHVPDTGPYLMTINHIHWLDPPALMIAFPYKSYVLAADKWRTRPVFGALLSSLDAIWVHRGEVDRRALREALAVLKGGAVLGLAPEGTRSKTGGLQEGKGGAAYLAYRAGVGVLPTVATGHEKVFQSLLKLRRARVRITFGPFFEPPPLPAGTKATSEHVQALSEEMMYRMAALLPPEYRGVYTDVEEARPDLMALGGTGDLGTQLESGEELS